MATASDRGSWMQFAVCTDVDPELFFLDGDGREANRICRFCPVKVDCLASALSIGAADGVWGGLNARERCHGRISVAVGLKPCGTDAAWQRHRQNGEIPCAACVTARQVYQELRRRRVKKGNA